MKRFKFINNFNGISFINLFSVLILMSNIMRTLIINSMKKLFTTLLITLIIGSAYAQPPLFNVTVNSGALPGYYYFVAYPLSAYPTFPSGTQNQMIIDGNGHVVY